MPQTWRTARDAYKYTVDLRKYERASDFPHFFERDICGNRGSTIEFEDYFRAQAPTTIEVWYEVAFWKLYRRGRETVTRMVKHTRDCKVSAQSLWEATQEFIQSPDICKLRKMKGLLGLTYDRIAVPLTFVAFAVPKQYPMVDTRVAKWVNESGQLHSASRENELKEFESLRKGKTTLTESDFESYLKWVFWCREVATVLSASLGDKWRARDVEMAVYTANDPKKKLSLSVLP